jgi:hypothetical protein
MPLLSIGDAIGVVGVALSGLATWYQFQRARRVSVDGISLVTWFQFMLMGSFWIAYGLGEHSPIVIAGSALCLPLQAAIVARLEPLRHLAHLAWATTFIVACCAVPTLLGGWAAGAIGCGVAMAANRLPQIVTLIRFSGDLGVSVASWAMGALCSVAWIGYYVSAHLLAALIATAAGMTGNLVIAGLAQWRHGQRDGEPVLVRPLARGAEPLGHSLQAQA